MSNSFLYIFLDEGGNFDFSSKGTTYFTLTSVTKLRPFAIMEDLGKYKYDLIEYGLDFEYFHCSHDNNHIRERVFTLLQKNIEKIEIDSLVVEKKTTEPSMRTGDRFYPEMLGMLLQHIIGQVDFSVITEVIVITDSIPLNKKVQAIRKAIKRTLKKLLPEGCRYRILHHASRSNIGLQVADYCNWAIMRKWERGEERFYNMIKAGIRNEIKK